MAGDAEHRSMAETLRGRKRQQDVLIELGQRAIENADIDGLLNEAVARVAQTLQAECCDVLELLPEGTAFLLRAGVGWADGLVGQTLVGAEAESQAGYTLRANEPVIVENLAVETRFHASPLFLEHGIMSGMSVIIHGMSMAQPFGVLGVYRRSRHRFTEGDRDFLSAVANLLALAIRLKQAERESESALTMGRALVRIGSTLISEWDVERVADAVVEQALEIFGADAASFWLVEEEGRVLCPIAHRPFNAAVAALNHVSYDAPLVTAMAAGSKRVEVVEDLLATGSELALSRHLASESGLRGTMAMPLLSHGAAVAVLTCLAREPRRFSPPDSRFLTMVAGICAFAIERARLQQRLFEREQQVNQLLKATIEAQEEERQRISSEIHDGVAQTLSGATGYLHLLAKRAELPAALHPQVEKAISLLGQALREVREITSSLRPSSLDVLGVVEALRFELAAIETSTGLKITFAADHGRFPEAIETAIYRIIREAMNNAIKHARASRLLIQLRREEDCVVVRIRDDGVGFDVLEIESQLHPRGLGLISMRKRAELLGGRVGIVSQQGMGTHIRVQIPLLGKAAQPAKPTAKNVTESATWKRGEGELITVLIVDDHAVAREGLRAMLAEDDEIQVVGEAADGQSALELVARLRPKVVLMDIRMPSVDGLEATRRLKAQFPTTIIIVITNYDDEVLLVDAIQAGASGYLLKGASREVLGYTIKAAVSGGTLISAELLRGATRRLANTIRTTIAVQRREEVDELTDRDLTVLKLVAEGLTNREIGDILAVAEVTVKRYVQTIIAKLRASDRTHAAITAMRLGLIS